MTLDRYFLNISAINSGHEFAKHDFGLAAVLFIEHTEDRENNQRQDQPQGDMFR